MKICSKCGTQKDDARFDKNRRQCRDCRYLLRQKYSKNHESQLLIQARYRAKKKKLEFNIDETDILIPEICPILQIPLSFGSGKFSKTSPTLDRIDSTRGYIKGNVVVISWRANHIKNDASLDELQKITTWLAKYSST